MLKKKLSCSRCALPRRRAAAAAPPLPRRCRAAPNYFYYFYYFYFYYFYYFHYFYYFCYFLLVCRYRYLPTGMNISAYVTCVGA